MPPSEFIENGRNAHRSYRVLLIAEAANPEWASVPLIGWSLSQALSKVATVHLVTQIRNRDAIARRGLVEGRDFTAIDNEHVAARSSKLAKILRGDVRVGWTTGMALSSLAYYSFERAVWHQFGDRLAKHEFDLVHRITPLSPTTPSPVATRLNKIAVPFVIGPLNGGIPWPRNFRDRQYAEREWLSHVRGAYKFMPGYRSTRRDAAAIIVGSKYTYADMPRWAQPKCVYIPENGVDPQRFNHPRDRTASLPLRGAFIGRLVPYKGTDMLLEAAAGFLKNGQLELHIIGDGPERSHLEEIVNRLGVRANVSFHGWVPHAEVQERLRTCDFLALPSIREFGGGVVLEFMALGVAPVVADYGGPAELVDDSAGFRVPFSDKQDLIAGLRETIRKLVKSPEVLDKMGAAGRAKVLEKLTWDAKAQQIITIYDAVLAGKTELQSLGFP